MVQPAGVWKPALKLNFRKPTVPTVFLTRPMFVGYARISTRDQSPDLQRDALLGAGCGRLFQETASGARRDRP